MIKYCVTNMQYLNYLTMVCVNFQIVFGNNIANNYCGAVTVGEPAVINKAVTITFVPKHQWEGAYMTWSRLRNERWETIFSSTNVSIYNSGSVFFLGFSNLSDKDDTFYYGDYVGNSQYCTTSTIHLKLIAPPSEPMFVNTRDFDGCKQCVPGSVGNLTKIMCNTTGGSEPLTLYISVAETRKRGYFIRGSYTTKWRFVNEDHMKEVKCEVSNNALLTPLTVVSELYIVRQPQKPELHIYNLIDDQPCNVSCTSQGGRPAGNVTMRISGIPVASESVTQTNTYDSSGTFKSTTVLNSMLREWDGRKLMCCVSHEILEKMQCSREASIRYTYVPIISINVSFTSTNVPEETSAVLQCTTKSDPVSTISWIKNESHQSRYEKNADPVLWPIVGAITAVVVLSVFGLVIVKIVKHIGDSEHIGSTNPDLHPQELTQHGQSTLPPGPSTPMPPGDVNTETGDDTYEVIRYSVQGQPQENPETSQVYELEYLLPITINIKDCSTDTQNTAHGCNYIDFNSKLRAETYEVIRDSDHDRPELSQDEDRYYLHPVTRENGNSTTENLSEKRINIDCNTDPKSDNYEVIRDSEQCRYPQPHLEINHDEDRYYLHPVTTEDGNTTALNPAQRNIYMDLNTESKVDAYVVTCDDGQCHTNVRPETNQNEEGDSVNRDESNIATTVPNQNPRE